MSARADTSKHERTRKRGDAPRRTPKHIHTSTDKCFIQTPHTWTQEQKHHKQSHNHSQQQQEQEQEQEPEITLMKVDVFCPYMRNNTCNHRNERIGITICQSTT